MQLRHQEAPAYPLPPPADGPGGAVRFKACEIFEATAGAGAWLSITAHEAGLIKAGGEKLNALIKRRAGDFGWHYIDLVPGFAGRGYCAKNRRMWVHAEESCIRQGNFMGTMHRNRFGHVVTAKRYRDALNQSTF